MLPPPRLRGTKSFFAGIALAGTLANATRQRYDPARLCRTVSAYSSLDWRKPTPSGVGAQPVFFVVGLAVGLLLVLVLVLLLVLTLVLLLVLVLLLIFLTTNY